MSVPCLKMAVFVQRIIFILISPTVIRSAVPREFSLSEAPKNHTKSYDKIIGLFVVGKKIKKLQNKIKNVIHINWQY